MTMTTTTPTLTTTTKTLIPLSSRPGRTKPLTSHTHVELRAATGIYVLFKGLEAPLQHPYVGARRRWALRVK